MATRGTSRCDLLVFGETTRDSIAMVDALPLPEGAAARVTRLVDPTLGGRAVNVATCARFFGIKAHILSACDQSYIDDYKELKLAGHASMEYMHTYADRQDNAQALIFRDTAHQLTFFYPGRAIVEGTERKPSDAERGYKKHIREVLSSCKPRFVYCTSELHALVDEVMQRYSRSGQVTCVYAPGPEVQRVSTEQLGRILSCTDILFLNYFEMQEIQRSLGASLVEIMRDSRVRVAVATLGHVGALFLYRHGHTALASTRWLPAANGKQPVLDATGAGDALAGGFLGHLAMLGRGKRTEDDYLSALKYGMALASFVVEGYGTLVTDVKLQDVEDRLKEYEARLG